MQTVSAQTVKLISAPIGWIIGWMENVTAISLRLLSIFEHVQNLAIACGCLCDPLRPAEIPQALRSLRSHYATR